MKLKLSQSVSQSAASCIILPNLHLCSGFFSSLHLFVSLPCLFMTFLFSPHVRFLMLVPKSGKAEGMTRPPSTSHLRPASPISPLSPPPGLQSLNQYHDFVVQCNTYLYVWLLTWWFWPVLYVFCLCTVVLTFVTFMSDFLLSVENKCCCVSRF